MLEASQRSPVESQTEPVQTDPAQAMSDTERERERCARIAEAAEAYAMGKLTAGTDEFQRGRASAAKAIALAIRTAGRAARDPTSELHLEDFRP